MKNARFRVPNINRDVLLAKFLSVPDAQLPFRFQFDFERMIFLESAHAEPAHRISAIHGIIALGGRRGSEIGV